jgi:alpha-L-arabinofuranosidase
MNLAATRTVFTGDKDAKNTFASPHTVMPKTAPYKAKPRFSYEAQPYSLTVIRLRVKR